jgi:para-aminobenzoate synthetase component 1
MDLNIAIRTLVCSNGYARFWAGGGIVADSNADAEYQETLDKAAPFLKVISEAKVQSEG